MPRPEGSYLTPEYRHEKEINEWIRTATSARGLTDKILKGLEDELINGKPTLEERLAILSSLKDVASTATKIIEGGIKVRASGTTPAVIDEDPEKVLAEMAGGRG